MVRDIVEMTITNELNPTVRKRLAEIVQLLQVYARLAELEIAAGERPGVGDVVLPEDTTKKVRGWTEGEGKDKREGGAKRGHADARARCLGVEGGWRVKCDRRGQQWHHSDACLARQGW